MHIVGFDLVSFWLGFIVGSIALFIFMMIISMRSYKDRKNKIDELMKDK